MINRIDELVDQLEKIDNEKIEAIKD